ncbi:hypothetical protein OUZ56_011649 [Daphnia magna]|uniref:Uncharacterized protein n=1 Tax=Daphnia magna TaxID=35525 RepID=A0ABQ9Z0R1_9CRUS|nr:hypothetical protein OUZ56_011649 [Daphnia magna]
MENAADRLTNIKKALNTNQRNRRSLVDGGGTILKWLFGVSTQKDLEELNNQIQNLSQNQREIIHIVDKQATVLNESLWETRTNAKLIKELRGQYLILRNATINIMEKITDMEDLELSHFEYFFQLDETFEAMNQILQWLQQLADSLDVGFSLLANGHLRPQIISPAKFNKYSRVACLKEGGPVAEGQ